MPYFKRLLACATVLALIGAAPITDPQAAAAKSVATAAIARINANDPAGLRSLFTDDTTILDEAPPFRWTGPNAATDWLKQLNENAATDGVRKFTQSGTDLLGFANDKARFVAPYDESLPRSNGPLDRGQWVFVLQRLGDTWKIKEAAWVTLP